MPLICKILLSYGAGADVVSGYEIQLALGLGFKGENIVFNGPLKSHSKLEMAVDNNILVNINGVSEIKQLQEISEDRGKNITVGLRVNPSSNVYPSEDPSYNALIEKTITRSKFGCNIDTGDAARVAKIIIKNKNLKLSAIHCHLGSQITDTDAFFVPFVK